MGMNLMTHPIKIHSLAAAREADLSLYNGIITIEDPETHDPFRPDDEAIPQLVLRFHDIACAPEQDVVFLDEEFVVPTQHHIQAAIRFAQQHASGILLIHCHAGMRRSPAIGLAILMAQGSTAREAVEHLASIHPSASPNPLMVTLTDDLFACDGALIAAVAKVFGPKS
jgi:predicted protein tyrosine phosphatase